MPYDTLVVLDYGSQTAQLIARRLREIGVYCELLAWDAPEASIRALQPKGIILSGSPSSVYELNAPALPDYVIHLNVPILGICYGMQLLTHSLGGQVAASQEREYGPAEMHIDSPSSLWLDLPPELSVWMSHADRIERLPEGFHSIAHSQNAPIAAMENTERHLYGIQFHPEVTHTVQGKQVLANFALQECGCRPDWTPVAFIEESIERIRQQTGERRVLLGLSGGVDSSVAAVLLHRAIGDRLVCVFIDHGLLRLGEADQVIDTFHKVLGLNLITVDASEEFFQTLGGVIDPEEKRRIIGSLFISVFEREASKLGQIDLLAQGTIYPDVIESAAPDRPNAHRIKSHHNVGGLPAGLRFELIEPLRLLFKDEVRRVGQTLGLPEGLVWRQPFPGPGLAVRCIGEITRERVNQLRAADAIFVEELASAKLLRTVTSQAFGVLLPTRSVGVMGDGRTYGETIALRAVSTDDFMTADWVRLPYDVLGQVSTRIINEVQGITRVVYDLTSKPPATIEWE